MEPLVSDFFKARGLTKFQIDSFNNFVNVDLKRTVDVNGFITVKLSTDDENQFSLRHFTASRKQPKTEAVLDAIFQADNESLRSFIERFNKEAVQYYTHKGQVATLHGDIEAARRVFNASSKGNEYIGQLPESKKSKATTSLPLPEISSIDLDSRFSKQENKDEKKLRKEKKEDDEASQEHRRPVPDGEFELMPFGEDPSRAVKIGTGLPELARKQLEACLKENADLFV
ncbi:unnamed protein product [Trifolium pratense]|uniref:Uncharacterized protein n=1 Tax=Trifolium pratense TaxID=57577 RepID=A0ACB0KLN8_TRIPR|nr:unnamed protein product [Trifolium pratense]